jgi:hypothetical protein
VNRDARCSPAPEILDRKAIAAQAADDVSVRIRVTLVELVALLARIERSFDVTIRITSKQKPDTVSGAISVAEFAKRSWRKVSYFDAQGIRAGQQGAGGF